jgi:hypothetical protein
MQANDQIVKKLDIHLYLVLKNKLFAYKKKCEGETVSILD